MLLCGSKIYQHVMATKNIHHASMLNSNQNQPWHQDFLPFSVCWLIMKLILMSLLPPCSMMVNAKLHFYVLDEAIKANSQILHNLKKKQCASWVPEKAQSPSTDLTHPPSLSHTTAVFFFTFLWTFTLKQVPMINLVKSFHTSYHLYLIP